MDSIGFLIGVFKFVILLFSLSVHEFAHAWTSSYLGDQTARMEGRVTLNPLNHIDPIGSLLFPAVAIFGPLVGFTFFSGLVFGWAKPTPIITRNFRRITRDDSLTTLAGPAANLLLAFLASAVLAIISVAMQGGQELVMAAFHGQVAVDPLSAFVVISVLAIQINLTLVFFNLLPIPPLDGSRLLRNLLPYNAVQAYDKIPIWVSYLFMFVLGGTVLRFLVSPLLELVYVALALIPGR